MNSVQNNGLLKQCFTRCDLACLPNRTRYHISGINLGCNIYLQIRKSEGRKSFHMLCTRDMWKINCRPEARKCIHMNFCNWPNMSQVSVASPKVPIPLWKKLRSVSVRNKHKT